MFSIIKDSDPLCIFTSNQHIPCSFLLSRALVIVSVLDLGHSNRCCVALVFISNSPVADDVEHPRMCPLAICRVSSMRWPSGFLAHF